MAKADFPFGIAEVACPRLIIQLGQIDWHGNSSPLRN